MAGVFYLAEIDRLGVDAFGQSVMAPYPPIREQTLIIDSMADVSEAFTGKTRFIQISCDATCSFLISLDPVATTSNQRMATNGEKFVAVEPEMKLSVIANT